MEKSAKKTLDKSLANQFKNSSDFVCQTIKVGEKDVNLYFIDNMIDKAIASKEIVEKVQSAESGQELTTNSLLNSIGVAGSDTSTDTNEAIDKILAGFVVVYIVGTEDNSYIYCPCQGYEKRGVEEPPTSAVQKGPREGFSEDINTNIGLIRKRLKSKDLCFEEMKIGEYTNTKVVICYISSVVEKSILKQVKQRLKQIKIDGIIDSFYIESLIAPKKSLLFKQIGNTEKPDVAVARMLEGRITIIVDGSPIVLTIPYLFLEDLQSGDDYYDHATHASFIRILRLLGMIISISLPGIYVALQSFHYALLPVDFLISLQNSIEGLSFPPLLEILVVLFLFEILNEASIRMPKYSGMALSIIGALVLGDTAVQAGIISPPAVIMVAVSGITLFTVPDQVSIVSILRILFTIVGGVAGFYGILIAFIFLVSYLISFESFGTPYFAPYAPDIKTDKKDGIFKSRLATLTTRPKSIPNKNNVRQRWKKH